MSGYFDDVLFIFEQHIHPFVLVGPRGLLWNGIETVRGDTIDVLVSH